MEGENERLQLVTGVFIALFSAVMLSTTGIIIAYLNTAYGVSPLVCALWRNVFLVLVLGVILELYYPFLVVINIKNLQYLVWYGLLLSVFNVSWQLSVALNGAGVATVLVCLSSIFTVVLAAVFLGEKMSSTKIYAVVIAFIGTILITEAVSYGTWTGSFAGISCGVFAGLCYSVYCMMGKKAVSVELNCWTVMLYSFLFAAGFILICLLICWRIFPENPAFHPFMLGIQWSGWGYILLLAVGPTLLGFGLIHLSFRYLQVSVSNLILTAEPMFTLILAFVLLGERLSTMKLSGSGLIIAAVFFVCWFELQENRKRKCMKMCFTPVAKNKVISVRVDENR